MTPARVLILLLPLICLCQGQHAEVGDLDPLDGMDEQEFEEFFGLDPIDDPEEVSRRNEALKKNEEEIKEVNEEYEEGKIGWYDGVNEFSDLTDEEFLAEKTGARIPAEYARGLLEPTEEERVDEASERYFDQFRSINRGYVPASYSSVDYGYVSPVRDQQQCGSCVAFSSMAAVEVCFKKASGVFGDYSEQQFVDCGYQQNGANGCNGAPPHAYLTWAAATKLKLAHESQYPYKNQDPVLYCPRNLPVYNQGVHITGSTYTYRGDEELMKKMIYEHGAVVGAVKSKGPFQEYKGGVFAGCPPSSDTDHAIAVVGYGTANGEDYWLIKNSWGSTWGENGFIRLKRGVNMCGIGKSITTVSCQKVAGPTDAPLTTVKPCNDQFGNCADMARTSCYQPHIAKGCPVSCGLCPGMTPARSYTCYNKFSNCNSMGAYCNQQNIKDNCKITCGSC